MIMEKILNDSTTIASLLVGTLGFFTAILTIVITSRNNKRNYKLIENKENREKSKSYNRVLGCLLKVYRSYIMHKQLYNENGMANFPDKALVEFIYKIDKFENEIAKFKQVVDEESEIIPEITMSLDELLDILSRFELLSEQIPKSNSNTDSKMLFLIFKRAHIYAVSELLDEYFKEIILEISKRSEVDNEFIKALQDFESEDAIEISVDIQKTVLDRMMESLSRQVGEEMTWDKLMQI